MIKCLLIFVFAMFGCNVDGFSSSAEHQISSDQLQIKFSSPPSSSQIEDIKNQILEALDKPTPLISEANCNIGIQLVMDMIFAFDLMCIQNVEQILMKPLKKNFFDAEKLKLLNERLPFDVLMPALSVMPAPVVIASTGEEE